MFSSTPLKFIKFALFSVIFVFSVQAFANNNYELALRAYKQGDVDAAFIYLKNAFQEDESHLPSKVLMGEVLLIKGFTHEAIQEFEEALSRGADPNLIVSSLSSSYIQTNNFDQLFELSEDRLNDTNNTELKLAKAHAYQSIGLLGKAEETYQSLLNTSFQRLRILSSQATFFITTGQLIKAEQTLQLVREEGSDSSLFHYLNAELNKAKEKFTEALQEYTKAYQFNPNDPIIKRGYASELMRARQFEEASRLVDEILDQTPSDPYALLFQARLLNITSESKSANQAFDAITQNLSIFKDEFLSENTSLQLIQGLSAYMAGNFESALTHLETYQSKVPNNKNAIALLANVYLNLGQNRRAQTLLDRQYELISSDLNLGILLCELYLDNNKTFKCEQLRDLLKFRFPNAHSLSLIDVKIHETKGRFTDALEALQENFDVENLSIESFLIYIRLLRQTNQQSVALQAIDKRLIEDEGNLGLQAIKANLLISTNQFDIAREVNSSVISKNPNSYSAQLNEASVSIATGNIEQAKALLLKLVERFPKEYQANFLLANVLLLEGNIEEAETKLADMVAIYNNEPAPLELLVRHYLDNKQYEKALTMVNKLNRDYFLQPTYIKLKADVHYALGQVNEAKKQLKVLFGLWQDSAVDLSRLARFQEEIGALDDAILSLQKSHELEANDFVQRRSLSIAIYAGNEGLSRDLLATLKAKYPQDPTIALLEGDFALTFSKSNESAIELYKKALALSPSNTLAAAKLYSLSIKPKAKIAFDDLMEKSLAFNADLSFHRNLLADFLLVTGRPEKAKIHYQHLLKNNAPNTAGNANNLGNILLDESKPQEARPHILLAYELLPDQAHILNTYGRLLINDEQFDLALGVLRQAYAKNARSDSIKYHLAYTLHKLDRITEANQILTQIEGKASADLQQRIEELSNLL
jgi:putative PEP-CTERM system TPR-repeat lipoprotein